MIKKTVSDKVIAANRQNAQRSTGPKNIAATKYNAMKHGLLARHIIFRTKEEAAEFAHLLHESEEEFRPEGMTQRMLAQEIAMCWWHIFVAHGELSAIRSRRMASQNLLRRFIAKSDDQRVSVLSHEAEVEKDSSRDEELDWECREIVLRSGTTNSDGSEADMSKTGGSSVMELRLGGSTETILRYSASVKRDLYRAIQTLQSLQSGRAAGGELRNS